MNHESLRDLLDFAVDLAWRAGRVTLAHYQTGVAAESKADASPVTIADREAERLLRERIEARYPDHGIMGEEFGVTRPDSSHRWILDPIDGTRSFMHGVPFYGVMVALEVEGVAVLGVLHFPALGESVWAGRGLGCWWDGRPARVSGVDRLSDALVLTTDVEMIEADGRGPGWNLLRARAGLTRTWGDCYGYALVATGRAEVMVDPRLAPWDAAPLRPIIEEAGGMFTDWEGNVTDRGKHGIATNAALAREVRTLLVAASDAASHPDRMP